MTAFAGLDPADYALPPEVLVEAQSPALVVFERQVRSNVARIVELLGGSPERWRPHVKTTKLPRVWRLLFEAGVERFKCATTRELDQVLATARTAGARRADVIYAMVPVGPAIERIGVLAAGYPEYRVSVLVEDSAAIARLPANVGVFVDVDCGMGRTGLPLDATERILAVARTAGPRFCGVHAYDGHHHGPLAERTRHVHADYDRVGALVATLTAAGLTVSEVVTSGTPAFLPALDYTALHVPPQHLHSLSPGTVVFHDLRSEEETPELGLRPAALVLTRVLSRGRAGCATLDAGSKGVSADADGPAAQLLGHPTWRVGASSEEHLPLTFDDEGPALGSVQLAIPRHVCTTVAQHDEALWIRADGRFDTLRVSARGHELFAPLPTSFV